MADKVVNALIAGIVGTVAFIAVRALVNGRFYGSGSNYTWKECYSTTGDGNISNCTYHDPSAGEMLVHDILPLVIAILVVAALFLGLTKVKGV